MPTKNDKIYDSMKRLVFNAVKEVFVNNRSNFLSVGRVLDLEVVRGENNLDTCYQYAVKDANKNKILNVKIYDKMLDLVARDGCKRVGSKIATILGKLDKPNSFGKRLSRS